MWADLELLWTVLELDATVFPVTTRLPVLPISVFPALVIATEAWKHGQRPRTGHEGVHGIHTARCSVIAGGGEADRDLVAAMCLAV